jgi:hypothetical protein
MSGVLYPYDSPIDIPGLKQHIIKINVLNISKAVHLFKKVRKGSLETVVDKDMLPSMGCIE